jgi:hypothetical protein
MRTQTITIRLPIHEVSVVRHRAADVGLTKSAFAANLGIRGLAGESAAQLPKLIDRLEGYVGARERIANGNVSADHRADLQSLDPRLQAFMIEVLLLLRYLTKNDLRLGGEIGRKLQKAVGDVRVEGT